MEMRRVVEWLFFLIICCNALLKSSAENGFISSEASGHDLKPLMNVKQLKNVFKNQRTSSKGLHDEVVYVNGKEEQNKKGKGSYGGGDLLRPRSKKSGANSLLMKSSSPLSTLFLRYVVLGFLPVMFFF